MEAYHFWNHACKFHQLIYTLTLSFIKLMNIGSEKKPKCMLYTVKIAIILFWDPIFRILIINQGYSASKSRKRPPFVGKVLSLHIVKYLLLK